MNQKQENFKLYLELFIRTAKDAKERLEIIKKEPHGSTEQKIQLEVLKKYVIPELNKIGSTIYSLILTHNKFPEKLPFYTNHDMLNAQLVMDECREILSSVGIISQYVKDRIFDDVGSGIDPE